MENVNQNPAENPAENEEKWESLDKVALEETDGGQLPTSQYCGKYYSISAECWGFSCNPFSSLA